MHTLFTWLRAPLAAAHEMVARHPARALRRVVRRAQARTARRGPLGRFRADTGGAVVVLAAILFPVVIGGLGLGVETSYWYLTQRKLQHAADLASHAGSARNRAGDTLAEIEAAAQHIARESGLPVEGGAITVNRPPASGAFTGDRDAVEVVLAETRTRWFTSLFASGPVTITARAVSRIEGGAEACILALSPTANGALTVSGSTQVDLENCDVASNSVSATSFLMDGSSASLTAGCAYAVGQASITSGLTLTECPRVHENAPVVRDPYRDVAEPAIVGSCQNRNVGHPTQATTVTPTDSHPSGVKSRRYCNGLDIKGDVTFEPGLYIIEGGSITFNGGDPNAVSTIRVRGSGVTFYMTSTSRLKLNGNVQLDLSAPTSGPFAGILFFGARDATSVNHVISGTSDSVIQGAVYTPASHIEYKGNSATTGGCTQVIGRTVTMTGNSTLGSSCENAGTQTILANEGIKIVE